MMKKFQEFLYLSALLIGVCLFGACSGSDSDDDNFNAELCPDNKHPHMIDLGLPSGTLWACCNVGASRPEDFGNYYAWGETIPKREYSWETYQYRTEETFINIGSDIAGTKYDAATVNWGKEWRMPTKEQFKELFEYTTLDWYGHRDYVKVKSSNGSIILFPRASFMADDFLMKNYDGKYWTSSSGDNQWAKSAWITSFVDIDLNNKEYGFSIRPVAFSSPSGNGGSNGGGSSGNGGGGNGGSSGSGTSKEAPSFYDFSYSYTETTISVIFATDPMATKATVYYGKSSPTQSVSTTITGRMINATIKGLTKGTKYYVKCVASNSYGSTTSETFPVMTDYYY